MLFHQFRVAVGREIVEIVRLQPAEMQAVLLALTVADLDETKTAGGSEAGLISRKGSGVRNPASVKKHARSGKITVDIIGISMSEVGAFPEEFGAELFVGVEVEDPLIFEGDGIEGEIALIGKIGESSYDDTGAGGLGDRAGSVNRA